MTALHRFERKADKPPKREMNRLIMDYLVNEGYPEAASKFADEANVEIPSDFEEICERVQIRDALHSGQIKTAIEKINELNPTILDSNDSLHFALLRLQLIELIRPTTLLPADRCSPQILSAISFATQYLAPMAPTNPSFLADFEATMVLLLFPHDKIPPAQAEILDPELRRHVADRVNQAILACQGRRREARIRRLVRMRAWAENRGKEGKLILGSGGVGFGLDEPGEGGRGRNGASGDEVREDGDGDTAMRERDGGGS